MTPNFIHFLDSLLPSRTLENPEERRKYLAGPLQADGSANISATGSKGRRIDYTLYRQHSGPGHLKTVSGLRACGQPKPGQPCWAKRAGEGEPNPQRPLLLFWAAGGEESQDSEGGRAG